MNRRDFLTKLSGSVALLAVPATVSAAASVEPQPFNQRLIDSLAKRSALSAGYQPTEMTMHNLHTDEVMKLKIHAGNLVDRTTLNQLSNLLRDHHTGERHQIDPNLFKFLAQVWRDVGDGGNVEIVSGYRSPRTNRNLTSHNDNAAQGSLHMHGKAIDFRIVGVPLKKVRNHAFTCNSGGVGYYPDSRFMHIDSGQPRFWGWWPNNYSQVVGSRQTGSVA